MPFIYQSDNYKTACESLSAVMALQYYNQNISPETFINNYLDKGSYESFDPNVCFGGDPCGSGMGCYAPVITKAVNKYVNKTGAKLSATTVQGQTLEYLCSQYIDKIYLLFCGQQQICRRRSTGAKFPYGNSYIQWMAPEHCLVLVGYDDKNYIFSDSQRQAIIYYGKDIVTRAYLGLGSQAVVITPTNRSNP